MKIFKTIGLTFFLTIGLIIPSCDKDSCDDIVFQNYFDITGISISSYSDFQQGTIISATDTVSFDEIDKIFIDYLVDYTVTAQPKSDWTSALMPSVAACSYEPGTKGSKEEALVNFSIITLNDFDSNHLANSNINDLFDYHGSMLNYLNSPISLAQFLDEKSGKIKEEDVILDLKKAPELNQEFKVRVVMELSTGEVFEVESEPIFIIL